MNLAPAPAIHLQIYNSKVKPLLLVGIWVQIFWSLLFSNAGFYFIPAALTVEEQCHWIRESLLTFPQPPNRTNHNAIYGPIHDLFVEAQKKKVLIEVDTLDTDVGSVKDLDSKNPDACRWKFSEDTFTVPKEVSHRSISASALLRKLRWSTLGLQFDWSKVVENFILLISYFWLLCYSYPKSEGGIAAY